MSERFGDFSYRNTCVNCKKAPGVHEINFNVWLCRLCFGVRQADIKAPHVNWPNRDSVDTLLEAVYYMAYIHKDKPWNHMFLSDSIKGDRGIVCYTVDEDYFVTTPLTTTMTLRYKYFVVYNRRYLYHGDHFFERASMHKGDWQTVRKDILDRAADLNESNSEFKGNSCIAIVMKDKVIHYINPSKMRKFCFEYEAERIPNNEQSPECSIPIKKDDIITRHDPFPPSKASHTNKL
jgi:hypothetical protein